MALSSLGKRTRAHQESDLPLKRPRRQTRSFVVINDENQDPENVSFADALAVDVSETPSKSRRHASSVSSSVSSSPLKSSPLKQQSSPTKTPLTPSTPRFRNGLASTKAVASAATTPRTPPLTPVTPRHRVMSAGKLSRRMTPHGPNTPTTPAGCQTIYHKARQLFSRSAGAGTLIGREEERSRLQSFLRSNCENTKAAKDGNGCLYVSGPPGTGKSAMVNEVTEETCAELPGVRKAYINCMSIRSSNDLYNTLLRLLAGQGADDDDNDDDCQIMADVNETDAINTLQAMFVPKKKAGRPAPATTYLVVLDEIDHILTLDLESLYRVLGWSMTKASRLVLVGIANALDLTDRFLPRLKARNLQPELLPFLPYTAPQIKNIVMTRLRSLVPADSSTTEANFLPFFHPVAIELCSRKVASQTGDLRKAFEILRRALDLVEAEAKEKCMSEARDEAAGQQASSATATSPTKKRPLGENMNLASSSPTRPVGTLPSPSTILSAWAKSLTIESAPRVSIGHLNKVTAAAFGNGAQQRLRGLNLQQKAALCALMALEKWNRESHAQQMQKTGVPAKLSKLGKGAKVSGAGQAGSPAAKGLRAGASAAPTIKMLFDTYCRMCKRDAVLHPLSSSEFREVVGSLETLSLVTAVDGRTGSFAVLQTTPGSGSGGRRRRGAGAAGETTGVLAGDEKQVASCVGEKELQQALEGAGADILRSILSGEVLD